MKSEKRKMYRIGDTKNPKNKMKKWIIALKKVLEMDNISLLSDTDLVFLVNKELQPFERIALSTFYNWKAGRYTGGNEEIIIEFIELIKESLIKQKIEIEKKMFSDTVTNWQKYAWFLERKFSEWNLKHISENINRNEQATVIQITAGNEEQKRLIDNIINGEFTEVKPIQLPFKNNENDNDVGF